MAGQEAEEPVQVSATSQGPAEARQTVEEDSNWQVEEQQSPLATLPSSHCSPVSITPLPQVQDEGPVHTLDPSHVSGDEHGSPSLHEVPAGRNPSEGHEEDEPVQVSAASH